MKNFLQAWLAKDLHVNLARRLKKFSTLLYTIISSSTFKNQPKYYFINQQEIKLFVKFNKIVVKKRYILNKLVNIIYQ